jgi:peptidyl-prolyl cis-trans isomerase SurA
VERRIERAQADASRAGMRLPPESDLRRQALDALIDERAMITSARESGMRVDDAEVDRAVQNIAQQNQVTMPVLRERLKTEGIDYTRFRANLRDQIMIERLREREVYQRIKISDEDLDRVLAEQRTAANIDAPTNIAQILVTVPEGADPATESARRAKAEAALARVRGGEPFDAVAREVSEDGNKAKGGEIGLRPASRLPDAFIEATRALKPGEITAQLLRTGAGFHVLKLIERQDTPLGRVTQTRARHVLLRTSPQLTEEVAVRRLAEYKRLIEAGSKPFEEIARQFSEDGSAAAGGDLGWAAPGVMVPEFETAMNALPLGGLSAPVVSRFGVHLIQVLERRDVNLELKQLREQARNVLREQRFEQAYLDWTKELRARAYVEMREPPQ